MSGIIGYRGHQEASSILMAGLRRIAHRGYDSVGMATVSPEGLGVRRTVGRLDELADTLEKSPLAGRLGIAHTRWATHGRPRIENAHPHQDARGRLALVHNGVIENHAAIRRFLLGQGVVFRGETDSEVLVHLVGFFLDQTGDLLESVRGALRQVRGTYGVAIISAEAPDTLIAARRGSPMTVGVRGSELIVASDLSAIGRLASHITELDDNEVVCLDPDGFRAATIDARPVQKQLSPMEASLETEALGGFRHHMQKEIFEQPRTLEDTLRGRVLAGEDRVKLGGMESLSRGGPPIRRVRLFGCGSSWHAALVGKYLLEELAGLPTEVDYASELRYRNVIVEEGTLGIAISASGETNDTTAALRELVLRGSRSLGIVNAIGSTIAREAEAGVYLHVGPEIGVASTKAFTAQITALAMVALDLGRRRRLSSERTREFNAELIALPEKVEQLLALDGLAKMLAQRFGAAPHWLVLGRGVNLPIALEAALKLKEVAGIHAEGLPAAEMKHGPIAIIDSGMPVLVIAPGGVDEAISANIHEIQERGGEVVVVVTEGDQALAGVANEVLSIPATTPLLAPILATIPVQLLVYQLAAVRGLDVDKPRRPVRGAPPLFDQNAAA